MRAQIASWVVLQACLPNWTKRDVMLVHAVSAGCDGTGSDGDGLLCSWFEDGTFRVAWLSESSVLVVKA